MRQLKINHSITNRDSESLEKYLQEISKIDLLSAEEEVELATNIKKWDQKSLEKLAKANLRFVVSVAKQYQGQWLSLNDLINEGNIWLIKAAQKFDETKWFKFISYAVWWIRQSILQAIAEQSRVVKLPSNKFWTLSKLNKAFGKLEQKYEREPTVEELAEILEIEQFEVEELILNKNNAKSLSEGIWWDSYEDWFTLEDVLWIDNLEELSDNIDDKSKVENLIKILKKPHIVNIDNLLLFTKYYGIDIDNNTIDLWKQKTIWELSIELNIPKNTITNRLNKTTIQIRHILAKNNI